MITIISQDCSQMQHMTLQLEQITKPCVLTGKTFIYIHVVSDMMRGK